MQTFCGCPVVLGLRLPTFNATELHTGLNSEGAVLALCRIWRQLNRAVILPINCCSRF
jgi:hypothetical protein